MVSNISSISKDESPVRNLPIRAKNGISPSHMPFQDESQYFVNTHLLPFVHYFPLISKYESKCEDVANTLRGTSVVQ